MARPIEPAMHGLPPAQILFDPLSYVHPQRLRLPRGFDTPRQRAVVNCMLLGDPPDARQTMEVRRHCLLPHWRRLPYVCALVGAQLLKPQLARGGRSLRLPAPMRFFMELPLQRAPAAADPRQWGAHADPLPEAEPLPMVQRAGLLRLLDWQRQAPAAVLERLRLLFPPQLDACFEACRRPLQAADLFLILQAIQYAKNHPYHV